MNSILRVLFLACLAKAALAVELEVGTEKIIVPPPEGCALITEDMQPYADESKKSIGPGNIRLAMFIPASEAVSAARGENPSPSMEFAVETRAALQAITISPELFGEIKQGVKLEGQKAVQKAMSNAEITEYLSKQNNGGPLDMAVVMFPSHDETEASLSWLMYSKTKTMDADGKPVKIETLMAVSMIHVKSKVLVVNVSNDKNDPALCKAASQQWVRAIIKANSPAQDPAPPAGVKWKKFGSPEGKYSVRSPIDLKGQVINVPTPKGEAQLHALLGEYAAGFFMAGYLDFQPEEGVSAQDRLNAGREGGVANTGGSLVYEKPVSLMGNPGLEYCLSIQHDDGFIYSICRSYIVGNRMYLLTSVGLKAESPEAALFFNSFKLEE